MMRADMNPWVYRQGRRFINHARLQCLECRGLHMERLRRAGPFVIACTHMSHLEPFLLSSMLDRPVHWVARVEMFRFSLAAFFMDLAGSIPIRRESRSVRAIRTSISYLNSGSIVGIFPEGAVKRGKDAIVRGGQFKAGAALIAVRAGVPIIPVVMLGTEKLNAVEPWLPGSCTKIRIGVGQPMMSNCQDAAAPISVRHAARLELANRIGREFVATYQEMLRTFNISDRRVP